MWKGVKIIMNRKSILKIICTSVLLAVCSASLTACGNSTSDSNESTGTITSTTAENSDSSVSAADTTVSEKSTEEPAIVTEAVDPVIADLSFLYGSPNKVEVYSRRINIKTTESADENSPGYSQADIDIIDNGTGYLLGVNKIKYYFGVSNIRAFVDTAIDMNNFTDVDGKREYEIVEGSNILNCCGEEFTLVSYTVNDMGRGNCEFEGADGNTYFLYNDISSYSDDFTGETFFKIVTEDGQPAFKEQTFDEGTYIEIPYDKAEGTGMKQFAANSPDDTSGNPAGYYFMQFGSDGNIVRIQGR